MKRTAKTVKTVAFALALAMLMATLALTLSGCGAKTVMTFEADNGKTYTADTNFFKFMMTYSKQTFYTQNVLNSSVESTIWDQKTDEGITYDKVYTDRAITQVKSVLIEQYLFDKYELTISDETIASIKKNVDSAVKSQHGKGYYKQYFGYTSNQLYDYLIMVEKSKAVVEYLYGDKGIDPVTAEELDKYYKDNYVGYLFIMLDMNNKVKTDENGNRVVKTTTDKDGKVTEQKAYETEKLTKEEKDKKETLAAEIQQDIKNGVDFEELVQKHSDNYYSVTLKRGVFIPKDNDLVTNASNVNEAVKKLEIGECTDALSTGDTNDYTYFVKRIELVDKVYEDEEYEDWFSDYNDNVKYDKYDGVIEGYDASVKVDTAAISGFTMKNTFLATDYVNSYYNLVRYYGYSS